MNAQHPDSTRTLVIDTATDELSVAVLDGNHNIVSHSQQTVWRDMAARLQPTIQEVLAQSQCSFNDLSAIYTNLGPGSFTSIRIGLAAVKALSFALAIPAYGASGMAALARSYKGKSVAVCLKAVGKDVYWQTFSPDGTPQQAPQCLPLQSALTQAAQGDVLLTNINLDESDDNAALKRIKTITIKAPNPGDIAATAERSEQGNALTPLYVRPLTYKKQIA